MKLKILSKKLIQKSQSSKVVLKSKLRKKILKTRKKINRDNIKVNFNKLINFLKEKKIKKKIVGGYFPVNFEVDDLDLLKILEKKNL